MEWINVKDRLPNKNGEYIVVYQCFKYRLIRVFRFALNLHEVDEFNFPDENRPGWYDDDSEVGYFEIDGVTHWAELPKLPTD